MKRYYFIISLIAFLSLSFSSCSNDDDDDKDSLVGVWVADNMLPMYEYGVTTSEVVGHVKVYFQFKEDGSLIEKDVITYIESGKTYTETSTYGRWSATEGHLKMIVSFAEPYENPKENADEFDYTYQFANGKLVLSYKDEETGQLITVPFVRGEMPKD